MFPRSKPPEDIEIICSDIKVCGRREMFALLKMRHKYQRLIESEKKQIKAEQDKIEKAKNQKELNESDIEA